MMYMVCLATLTSVGKAVVVLKHIGKTRQDPDFVIQLIIPENLETDFGHIWGQRILEFYRDDMDPYNQVPKTPIVDSEGKVVSALKIQLAYCTGSNASKAVATMIDILLSAHNEPANPP